MAKGERGVLGISYGFLAALMFILLILGSTTAILLVAGFIIVVEKKQELTGIAIQVILLQVFVDLIYSMLRGLSDGIAQIAGNTMILIDTYRFLINTVIFLKGFLGLAVFVLAIIGIIMALAGNLKGIPGLSALSNRIMGIAPVRRYAQPAYPPQYAQPQYQQPPVAPAAPVAPAGDSWTCSCGAVNTGGFCTGCGSKKP